jgi:4-diphosphocytidyl-2-C-methyl-D-erythritol kinase
MAEAEDAPAKLNLYLRSIGRRGDGYHDIDTLVAPLSLMDRVSVEPIEGDDTIRVTVTGPAAGGVPAGGENLAAVAVSRLRDRIERLDVGAAIDVDKRIPIGAGLGGGSADAAAVLRILGGAWGVPADVLAEVAAAVGSDVPALLPRGPVVAGGRGERVSLVELPRTWWVLVPQPFEVSSADAYGWWDEDGADPGPEPDVVVAAAMAGDVDALTSLVFNDLEPPVAARHPEIAGATRMLLEAGALTTIMCGSGPTVAGLCRDEPHATDVAASTDGILVHTVQASDGLR